MNTDKLLALYHFCNLYHGGQFTRLYRLGCKVSEVFTPSHSEEFVSILNKEGYEEARRIFLLLTKNELGRLECSGVYDCSECGCAAEGLESESAIILCSECQSGFPE
jgi:hypothetical protein